MKPLTPEQLREALERANRNYQDAAVLLGANVSTLRTRIKRLRAEGHEIPGPMGHINRAESFYCPTRQEIEQAAAEIRANWPANEHAKRARWAHCVEYEIPRMEPVDLDVRDDIW